MSAKLKSTLLWFFSIIFTISIAIYQKVTGPTYPLKDKITINGQVIKFKLIRSAESDGPGLIEIKRVPELIDGNIKFKRFKVIEEWTKIPMKFQDGSLIGELPQQPPAGKLEYFVELSAGTDSYRLSDEPVVVRFKGVVPLYILIPHILFMFVAMLLSTRTGLEALFNGRNALIFSLITVISLFIGGMILGPVVQKFAFGEYWTGWPFGMDLTDNKTLIAFIGWVVAYFRLRKNPGNKFWPIAASIILLLVYLVPHSMFGSELDYTSGEINTGK
ncbi:MAG: hypothetical protein K9H58_19060 [Bacteroidales bacterium]|nr:hypothetical protein [Bacteroidales bacterium]